MEQPGAAPDLVGRTSARLLAAGVDRRERLDALHLLAILDASVDASGRVRRPLDDLAGEFDLPPVSVMRSLDHLEEAEAVRRDGGHVVLLGDNPRGLGGMQLADFLEDVRSSFDGDAPVHPRSGWLARGGAALVAVAAAVAVLTLAPSQSVVEQPLAMRESVTSTTEQDADLSPTAFEPPIVRIRPTTTIVAPMVTTPLDTAVVAATEAVGDACEAISEVADRIDCLIVEELTADGGENLPQGAPAVPEPAPTPTTEAPAPVTPDVATEVGLPVEPSIEGVAGIFRS